MTEIYYMSFRCGSRETEIVLAGPKSHHKKTSANEVMVVSPSDRGTGLIRMIIADRYSAKGNRRNKRIKKGTRAVIY